MALGKDFKVKDTINVGVSGLFGSGIRIGDGSTFPSAIPAIDAWGPILSGGFDISEFFGDGVDNIKEGSTTQGTIQFQTQNDAWTYGRTGDAADDVWTDVEVLGLQGYDSPVFTNIALSGNYDSGTSGPTTAVLSGADTIIIDPGGYGNTDLDPAGKVRIKGDLYVDGTTTTINSTTVSLSDAVVQLGWGENQFLDADGKVPNGGVGIQAGNIDDAKILYQGADGWEINGNSLTSLVDFNVGTDSDLFQVEASTGNVYTDGTLSVNGDTTLSGAFTIVSPDGAAAATKLSITQAGAIDGESTLNIAGLATFENDGTDGESVAISSLGGVSLSGDLRVDDHGSSDTNYFLVDNSTGETTIASATISDLTDNRIVIAGTNGIIEDDANFTFNGTTFQIKSDGTGFSADTNGNVNANGTTSLSGALYVKTDGADSVTTFSVAQDTGDVMTQGDLDVNGTTTLSGDLIVKTDVAGVEQFSVQQSTGNVSISGTTDIKGATNIDNTLQTNDAITIREVVGTATPRTVEDVFSGSSVIGNVVTVTCGDSDADSIKFIVVAQETDNEGNLLGGRSTAELLTLTTTNYTDGDGTAAATGGIVGTHYAQVDNDEVAPLITDIEADATGTNIQLTVTCKSFAKVTVFSTAQYL